MSPLSQNDFAVPDMVYIHVSSRVKRHKPLLCNALQWLLNLLALDGVIYHMAQHIG